MFPVSNPSVVGLFFLCFAITFFAMPAFVAQLKRMSANQVVSSYLGGIGDHAGKSSTPAMGGLLVIGVAYLCFLLFFGKLVGQTVGAVMAVGFAFCLLGFADDYKKVSSKQHFGLLIRIRFSVEVVISAVFLLYMQRVHSSSAYFSRHLLVGKLCLDFGVLYFIMRLFVVTGTANGVNITDGLDGLAGMPLVFCFAFMGFVCYWHYRPAAEVLQYLPQAPDIKLLLPLCIGVCGSLLGFLWHNVKPAKIFMGDTGSLGLGGLLGAIAVAIKAEILLAVVGFVFVVETLSCVVQIGFFKAFGRRLFLMAPIHHQFEKKGLPEVTIVPRAWIISLLSIAAAMLLI